MKDHGTLFGFGRLPENRVKHAARCDFWDQATRGSAQDFQKLLDGGADIRYYDDFPLRIAVENNRPDLVKMLLEAGADVHVYNNGLIKWTAARGYADTTKVLLEHGASPNTSEGRDSPLDVAVEGGHTETVRVLLEAGADPNSNGGVPLRVAAALGSTAIVKLLFKYKASHDNELALSYAMWNGHYGVAVLLVEHGADYSKLPKVDKLTRKQVIQHLVALAIETELEDG